MVVGQLLAPPAPLPPSPSLFLIPLPGPPAYSKSITLLRSYPGESGSGRAVLGQEDPTHLPGARTHTHTHTRAQTGRSSGGRPLELLLLPPAFLPHSWSLISCRPAPTAAVWDQEKDIL